MTRSGPSPNHGCCAMMRAPARQATLRNSLESERPGWKIEVKRVLTHAGEAKNATAASTGTASSALRFQDHTR